MQGKPGNERGLTRRTLLLGGLVGATVVGATAFEVENGVLPGRTWLYAHLGLDGPAGQIPSVRPGPLTGGSFRSAARRGHRVGWSVAYPPGHDEHVRLPLVVVLHLAGLLGSARIAAVIAESPALWETFADTTPGAFDGAADFARNTVFGREASLRGIALRVDCGRGDPFYAAVRDYVARLSRRPAGGFQAGGHTLGYWRRMAPAQLAFLARHLPAGP